MDNVFSTLIAPTATMVGGLLSHPQTWRRNVPAIFWLIAMSWCAMLGDCGCFSWLRSEPCFINPIGLGGNWFILLQPHKKTLSKPWLNVVKHHYQQHYPPQRHSFHIHHMLIYYTPPPHASGASKHLCKLICGIRTMDTHNNAMMKVPMPVSTMVMVAEAAVVAEQVQGFGGHIRLWALANGCWWSFVAMANTTRGL